MAQIRFFGQATGSLNSWLYFPAAPDYQFVASPLAGIPVALGILPLHHIFGLNVYWLKSCLSPSTLVILPQWNINLVLELIPKCLFTIRCHFPIANTFTQIQSFVS